MAQSILLVDDDPTVLKITSKLLSAHGYEVIVCDSAEAAIIRLRRRPNEFDCVLLDWKLKCPIDGDMILKIIKHYYPQFDTPIVFITGHTDIASRYLFQIGAFDVVAKPASADELLKAVRNAIDRTPAKPERLLPDNLTSEQIAEHKQAKKIIEAITSSGSIREAANKLNFSRATLYRWLDTTGLRNIFIDQDP